MKRNIDQAHLDRLAEMFRTAPIVSFLGQRLVHCRDGIAEVRLPFREEFVQGIGVIHGGIISTVADTAAYFAAASIVTEGVVTTVEFKINLVASAKNESLTARSEVVSSGKNLLVCQFKVAGDEDKLIAIGQGTFFIMRGK